MSDHHDFGPVSTEAQAYVLGQIAAGVRELKEGVIKLRVHSRKKHLLKLLSELGTGPVWSAGGNVYIESPSLVQQMHDAGLPLDAEQWKLPEFAPPLRRAFVRGLFDTVGCLPRYEPEVPLSCSLPVRGGLVAGLQQCFPGALAKRRFETVLLTWREANALDLLGELYESASVFRASRRQRYLRWASSFPSNGQSELSFHWSELEDGAVAPFKARVSDSGYDLTLIRQVKQLGNVVLYGTGLSIRPPTGWYFDVVPRSSIIESGHIFANSVGVIDRSYRGEIMVPLIKIDQAAEALELPARVAQLIPRPIVHMSAVKLAELDVTQRGRQGFGSTGR